MKRTIKDISRREMYAMAQEYAETDYLLSGNYFAERYEISTSTFYAVLHKAISESLVSIEIARKITQKAAYNTGRHGGEAAKTRIFRVYQDYIRERETYRFDREEAKKWVRLYIDSEDDIEAFAKKKLLNLKILKRALYDVVTNSWLGAEYIEKLREKTIMQNTTYFERAFEKVKNGEELSENEQKILRIFEIK